MPSYAIIYYTMRARNKPIRDSPHPARTLPSPPRQPESCLAAHRRSLGDMPSTAAIICFATLARNRPITDSPHPALFPPVPHLPRTPAPPCLAANRGGREVRRGTL